MNYIDIKESRKRAQEKAKENLDDSYIIKIITRGSKLKPSEVPQELITLKRLSLQMKKAVERVGKGIVTFCKYHGQLTKEECIRAGKQKSGALRYRCRACMKEMHRKNYERNRDRLLQKHAVYREVNKEKISEIRKAYWQKIKDKPEKTANARIKNKEYRQKHREKIRKRESEWKRKTVELLTDSYLKRLISESKGIPRAKIAREMIEAKRNELKQKRALKQLEFKFNQEENNHVQQQKQSTEDQ